MPLKPLDENDRSVQSEVADALERRRADVGNVTELVRTVALSPAGLVAFVPMSRHIRVGSSLSSYQRELVILRTAYFHQLSYVTRQHVPIAEAAGLSQRQIASLAEQDAFGVAFTDASDLSAIQLVDGMLATLGGHVSADLLNDARTHFSDEQIVDMGLTTGWYALIGTLLGLTDLM